MRKWPGRAEPSDPPHAYESAIIAPLAKTQHPDAGGTAMDVETPHWVIVLILVVRLIAILAGLAFVVWFVIRILYR